MGLGFTQSCFLDINLKTKANLFVYCIHACSNACVGRKISVGLMDDDLFGLEESVVGRHHDTRKG
jgi:hypothetical protein